MSRHPPTGTRACSACGPRSRTGRMILWFGEQKLHVRPVDASQEEWFTGRCPAAGSDDLCFAVDDDLDGHHRPPGGLRGRDRGRPGRAGGRAWRDDLGLLPRPRRQPHRGLDVPGRLSRRTRAPRRCGRGLAPDARPAEDEPTALRRAAPPGSMPTVHERIRRSYMTSPAVGFRAARSPSSSPTSRAPPTARRLASGTATCWRSTIARLRAAFAEHDGREVRHRGRRLLRVSRARPTPSPRR